MGDQCDAVVPCIIFLEYFSMIEGNTKYKSISLKFKIKLFYILKANKVVFKKIIVAVLILETLESTVVPCAFSLCSTRVDFKNFVHVLICHVSVNLSH